MSVGIWEIFKIPKYLGNFPDTQAFGKFPKSLGFGEIPILIFLIITVTPSKLAACL